MSNIHKMIKLNDGIYSVRGTWMRNISLFPTRSFILKNEDKPGILVIDTCGYGSGKIIFDGIKSQGLNPEDITGIAITHWHGDHTGGLAELVSHVAEAGGGPVKVFIHEAEAKRFMSQRGEFIKIHPLIKFPVFHKPGKTPAADEFELVRLSDAMENNPLDYWGVDFIHTPGHTPGHTSFLHRGSMSLFSGCGLSLFGSSNVGIVPVFNDRKLQIESAHKIMEMNFRFLYPAHMNLRMDEITIPERIPFNGKVSFIDRITGTLPLFRYPSGSKS